MRDRAKVEDLLGTSDLQVRSAVTVWKHVNAEFVDVVDDILETLAPSGPYAYTVLPETAEGKEIPDQRIVTTFEDIERSYRNMHRVTAVVALSPVTEINASWYTFVAGLGHAREKLSGAEGEGPILVLFPTMGSDGITGELFWNRTQQDGMAGDPARGPLAGRLAVAELHEQLLGAYRKGDIDSIVEKAHRDIQTGVRDYVAQTGTLVSLHTKDELREYLQDFYDRYSVLGIEVVTRQFDDWYFFHELRWTVEAKKGPAAGRIFRYHTAEYAEVTATGLLTAHIGHGTDQVEVG